MEDIIRGHPELAVWTILILALATCYIVKVLAAQWRVVQQAELEIALKEQMIQRGMSATEIAQVLQVPAEPEPERPVPASLPRRSCSSGKGWLWAAIGVPVAMIRNLEIDNRAGSTVNLIEKLRLVRRIWSD